MEANKRKDTILFRSSNYCSYMDQQRTFREATTLRIPSTWRYAMRNLHNLMGRQKVRLFTLRKKLRKQAREHALTLFLLSMGFVVTWTIQIFRVSF